MKLDEFMENVMNLDINNESMNDTHSHSHYQSTVCSNFFNIDTQSIHIKNAKKYNFQ